MITAVVTLMRRSFSAVVLGTAGWWAWSYVAPSLPNRVADAFTQHFGGWTERGCERNKEVCLTAKLAELESLHAEVSRAVTALADRKGPIARDLADRERDLANHAALLDEGRQLYGRFAEFQGAIRFAGREYTPDALKRRLEALFQANAALQAAVKQARALDEAVDRKLGDVLVKKANVRATRDLLPSQLELVRANLIIGDVDATLRDVTKLSDTVKSAVKEIADLDGWLTDTGKTIQRLIDADRGQAPDFAKWLGRGQGAPAAAGRQDAQ